MLAPTHVVIGTTFTIAIARLLGLPFEAPHFAAAVIGSLAPDIDGDGSITRPGAVLRRFLPKPAADFLNSLGSTISAILRLLLGHRGFIHAPVLGLTFLVFGILMHLPWLFWFSIGYLSHILADACTVYGVPLLSPFSKHRHSLLAIRTGKWEESIVFMIFLLLTLWLGMPVLPQETQQALFHWYSRIMGSVPFNF